MAGTARNANALQARKQEVVRTAIWNAAVDLFVRTGFEQATVDEIASRAGVSTRTFFRYFASKNDLLAHGMVAYRALLTDAIRRAPGGLTPLGIVRHTVRQVAVEAAGHPRTRELVLIASTSAAAREAQLSRRGEVEHGVAQAFAVTCGTAGGDAVTPRLLAALTLSVLDLTFREWATRGDADIAAVADDVCTRLVRLLSDAPRPRRRPRLRGN